MKAGEQTVFNMASCTKSFTAACVALLCEEGQLHWDDPVVKHLPEFRLYDPFVTRAVTLRDLACHRTHWQQDEFEAKFGRPALGAHWLLKFQVDERRIVQGFHVQNWSGQDAIPPFRRTAQLCTACSI